MKLTFTSEAGLVSEDFSASQIINGEVIPIFFDEEGEYEKWIEGSKVSVSGAALSRQEGEVTNTPTATAKPKRRRLTKNTDNDTPDSDGDSGGDVDDNSSGNATASDGQRPGREQT